VRVATFNVLHGRSPSDGLVVPSRLADAVREIDADVLVLQEVDRQQPRSHGTDLTAVAAEAMQAVAARFVPALTGAPGGWHAATGHEPPDAPGYGVALLSRHPVTTWRTVRLPALRVPVPLRWRGMRPQLVHDEPRVAVVARVDAPEGPVWVAGTHLSFLPGWNAVQLHTLVRELGQVRPAVLAGDLNMPTSTARRTSGMTPLAAGLTFPALAARRQIDHLLGRDVRARGPARTHALALSDHRALSVDVSLDPVRR
jgi:endonuclease/exonuclease/phosphatase family metal-dependent hydrolase